MSTPPHINVAAALGQTDLMGQLRNSPWAEQCRHSES